MNNDKYICNNCGWTGLDTELLRAKSPFDEDDVLIACPKCKTVNDLTRLCLADNCYKPASCGTPTAGGYMLTCLEHMPNN